MKHRDPQLITIPDVLAAVEINVCRFGLGR
jgi:hypothetical protein